MGTKERGIEIMDLHSVCQKGKHLSALSGCAAMQKITRPLLIECVRVSEGQRIRVY